MSFKNRNDVGLFNAVVRQQVLVVINHDHNLVTLDALDQPLDFATTLEGHAQLDLYFMADKRLVLFQAEQRPVHARG